MSRNDLAGHGSAMCVAWTWVDDCGFAHGRLCGSCCGGTGDQTSSTCEGSTSEGKLVNITEVDMRARCAANPRCVGYQQLASRTALPTFMPMRTFVNHARVMPDWMMFRKDDHCAIPSDAPETADSGEVRSAVLLQAANSWARDVWAEISRYFDEELRDRQRAIDAFMRGTMRMPRAARRLPVLYLFSGPDLWNAQAMFPDAPHYTLVSALPAGDLRCLTSTSCRSAARNMTREFMGHWRGHGYAWTETTLMLNWLLHRRTPETGQPLGVLPLLLLSLQMRGHELTGLMRPAGAPDVVVLSTDRGAKVTYSSRALNRALQPDGSRSGRTWLKHELSGLEEVLVHSATASALSPQGRWVSVIKAAESTWTYTSQRPFQSWLLQRSAAIVHDETGLQPSVLSNRSGDDEWAVRSFGSFASLEQSYARLWIAERWDIASSFCRGLPPFECEVRRNQTEAMRDEYRATFKGPELPFQFGYGCPGGRVMACTHLHANGVMLAAWRTSLRDGKAEGPL